MNELEKKVLNILQSAVQSKASDVHLAAGQVPAFRTHEGLIPASNAVLSEEDITTVCNMLISKQELRAKLAAITDLDGSYEFPSIGRFRYNIFRQKNHLGIVLRVVSAKVPSIDELGLTPVLKSIAEASRGLVLITGATCCGKSTTLAAMIDHINSNQACHIVTIEDPIEFSHIPKLSRITQREVGRDTDSYAAALRSALRQDPDIILIGEMRDMETLNTAMKAAATGHLVFSTVHTANIVSTISHLVSMYPAEEQQTMRQRLADNLHAVISQRFVSSKDSKTNIVAQEILVMNLAARECITNPDRLQELHSFMEKGHEVLGSQSFDQHLTALVRKNLIAVESAIEAASNPADLQRNLTFASGPLGISEIPSAAPVLPKIPKPPKAA